MNLASTDRGMRGLTRSLLATGCLALGCVVALGSSAEAAGVKLPITPPAGAASVLADYLDICSTGLKTVSDGGQVATAKGWTAVGGDANGAGKGEAAAGLFSATKGKDGDYLTISRVEFPHVVATTCQMVLVKKPADLDISVLTKIDGVVAGGGVAGMKQQGAGFWSFVDDTGEVVTMTAIPAGGTHFVLSMGRAELTKLGRDAAAKLAG